MKSSNLFLLCRPITKSEMGKASLSSKRLMEGLLPQEIIYRKKMGFTVPTQRWFAGELLEPAKDIILGGKLMNTGWFQKKYLENMFERHSRKKGRLQQAHIFASCFVLLDGYLYKIGA
jgi:asparagine synthetase B (glutamine-hydrolysing)